MGVTEISLSSLIKGPLFRHSGFVLLVKDKGSSARSHNSEVESIVLSESTFHLILIKFEERSRHVSRG